MSPTACSGCDPLDCNIIFRFGEVLEGCSGAIKGRYRGACRAIEGYLDGTWVDVHIRFAGLHS